jgi:hypothetical protein
MAELKNFMYSMLFITVVFCFGASIFSFAVTTGSWSAAYPRTFSESEKYLNRTNTLASNLANQTGSAGNAPPSTDPTLTYGVFLTVGLQILTLPFDAINLAIQMLFDIANDSSFAGTIPPYFITAAIIFFVYTLVLGVLAAVVKWYL